MLDVYKVLAYCVSEYEPFLARTFRAIVDCSQR